jgi:2,5-dioxopentanoate dehydrogenase
MTSSGKNIIGFDFSSKSKNCFCTYNPLLEQETRFCFPETTDEEFQLAVSKASQAFVQVQELPIDHRIRFLDLIAQKLDQNRADLMAVFQEESALPESRAIVELNRTIFQIKHVIELLSKENWVVLTIEEADLSRKPNTKPSFFKKMLPLGPVVVFGASNFPFAYSTIGGDSVSALAAGCPVIVKSHFMHAGTGDLVAQLVCEAAKETGMPDGIFSNLNSKGFELGQKLVLHPEVKAVGFTGSFKGGMALQKLIQTRKVPIPIYAEMGSVNPIFLMDSAFQQKDLVGKIASSISLNAGQFCTNPGLLFMAENQQSAAFLTQLTTALSKIEPQVMVHPNLKANYDAGIERNKKILKLDSVSENDSKWVNPVLLEVDLETFLKHNDLQVEVFGMHTIAVKCTNEIDFLRAIAHLNGQLTASVFTNETESSLLKKIVDKLVHKAGRLIFNGIPTGVEVTNGMHHGGPFPATTDAKYTAVGQDAVFRFMRPVSFQNFPYDLLTK